MTQVNIVERITELLGEFPEIELETGELHYSIRQGYETFYHQNNDREGCSEFQRAFHPNGVCEGRGICKWCGKTL